MTRIFCAHSPLGTTEACLCGSAWRCELYPEAARRMREQSAAPAHPMLTITITAQSHPVLHHTLVAVLADNGVCHGAGVRPDVLTPPARLVELVEPAEAALALLTEEERYIMVDPDETELAALISGDPGRQAASTLLDHFLGHWDEMTGVWGDIDAGGEM